MKRFYLILTLFTVFSLACSLTNLLHTALPSEGQQPVGTMTPIEVGSTPEVQAGVTNIPQETDRAVLYFGIMVHLEGWSDDRDEESFKRHAELMREYATLFKAYGAKLTFESKEVTDGVLKWGDNVLLEMQERGHGVGVHADIGGQKQYDCNRFVEDLRAEKEQLESLGVTVRHVSGIVSHCDWVTAAADAGYLFTTGQVAYAVMSMPPENRPPEYRNCKTPATCHDVFPADLSSRLHPWRMNNGADWLTPTPNGRLVLLPSSGTFCLKKDAEQTCDEFFQELEQAIALSQPGLVNTYYISWSFGDSPEIADIEAWLQRLDTYVKAGKIEWKTLPEMYDSFVAWEAANMGTNLGAAPGGSQSQTTATLTAVTPVLPAGTKPCGDGVCQGPENPKNCPVDCAATPGALPKGKGGNGTPSSASKIGEGEYTVTNPASGAALHVQVFYPENWDGHTHLPALVLVPGGNGDSSHFLRPLPAGSTVEVINKAGYVAVIFDPDGRGKSGGTENYNGFIHQDGLAEVIRFSATLAGIDSSKIGLVTYSYGITMGAGTLARHPDLPVKFLIDWEGPANRNDTGGCDGSWVGHLGEIASCTDEAFWAEREASTFIAQIRVPYQRIQSEKDHAQPDNTHAILMVNNAVNGGAPWVRLNNETPNQTYNPAHPPAMLPDNTIDKQVDSWVVQYASELFGL